MPKGANAKLEVANKIAELFGKDYIGEFDRKYYIWANDGNEKVQISITLTCPKIYRGIEETATAGLNFEDEDNKTEFKPAEITKEETDKLEDLIKRLGL